MFEGWKHKIRKLSGNNSLNLLKYMKMGFLSWKSLEKAYQFQVTQVLIFNNLLYQLKIWEKLINFYD